MPGRPRGGKKVEYTSSFEDWEIRHRRQERRQLGALISVSAVPIGLVFLLWGSPAGMLVVVLMFVVFLVGFGVVLSANRLR